MIELAGAPAIASTSAGVSWVHGRPDGQMLERREMIEAIRRMVQAVTVPVTADIEGGYGSGSIRDVAETVRAVIGQSASISRIPPGRTGRCSWRRSGRANGFKPRGRRRRRPGSIW